MNILDKYILINIMISFKSHIDANLKLLNNLFKINDLSLNADKSNNSNVFLRKKRLIETSNYQVKLTINLS